MIRRFVNRLRRHAFMHNPQRAEQMTMAADCHFILQKVRRSVGKLQSEVANRHNIASCEELFIRKCKSKALKSVSMIPDDSQMNAHMDEVSNQFWRDFSISRCFNFLRLVTQRVVTSKDMDRFAEGWPTQHLLHGLSYAAHFPPIACEVNTSLDAHLLYHLLCMTSVCLQILAMQQPFALLLSSYIISVGRQTRLKKAAK